MANFKSRYGHYTNKHAGQAEDYCAVSRLYWKDVQIQSLAWDWMAHWLGQGYFHSQIELGGVTHAFFRDVDYHYRDGSLEELIPLCESHHSAGDGEFISAFASIGYSFRFPRIAFAISPNLGFSYRQLRFVMTGGNLISLFGEDPPDLGRRKRYIGLDSFACNRWYSPFLGLDLVWDPWSKLHMMGRIDFHILLLKETDYWNLRPFRYTYYSLGLAIVIELNILFPINERCSVGLQIGHERWDAMEPRINYTFVEDDGSITEVKGPHYTRCSFENAYIGLVYSKVF